MYNSITGHLLKKDLTDNKRLNILYLPCNQSQYRMSCMISNATSFNNYIYFDGIHEDQLNAFKNSTDNAKLFKDLKSVAAFFKLIDRVVVFVGSVQIFLPENFNKILCAALENKIPVIEMPHGLFQSGYNLTDDSRVIDSASYYDGFGGSFPSITTKKLWWYGEESIGYPRSIIRNDYPDRILPDFTLITTNTNWYLYSKEDKRNFYKILFDYVAENPSIMFIWSPHPAEMNVDAYSYSIANEKPGNLFLYGIDKDIYFESIENTDDLIKYCAAGISTVSTCLLDYEMHAKPVNVFSCPGVYKITSNIESATIFQKKDEIERNPRTIKTGFYKEFDAIKYEEEVSDSSMAVDANEFKYLKSFL